MRVLLISDSDNFPAYITVILLGLRYDFLYGFKLPPYTLMIYGVPSVTAVKLTAVAKRKQAFDRVSPLSERRRMAVTAIQTGDKRVADKGDVLVFHSVTY